MKLVAVQYSESPKVDFTWERSDGKQITVTLAEKYDWPCVVDSPLPEVERWFKSKYNDLLNNYLWDLDKIPLPVE